GRFGRNAAGWSTWQEATGLRLDAGNGAITLSRLDYTGEREHSAADLRNLNARVQFPISEGGSWRLTALSDVGDDPRADNPGALTLAELRANRDSAAAINITRHAGKDVSQVQSGVTLQHSGADGREATVTVYGVSRDLKNPQTFAYIDVNRVDYGVRTAVTVPLALASMRQRLTAGLDFQRQRDDRKNFAYRPGTPLPDTSRLLDQLEHVTELGPFVQSVVELTPGTTVTGGLRYDWVSFQVDDRLPPDDSGRRLMQALSGSLGITATPSDAVTVYANVSSSFETPTTTELANRPDTAGGFNPILQPQKAWNYE